MDLPVRYDLFRYRSAPDLVCVVPEGRPAPAFVNESWPRMGILDRRKGDLVGFDPDAARVGLRFNGFHLFQTAGRCP